MKSVSLTQERNRALAYLGGVVSGDGWCSALTLGLRVSDEDFADAFAMALKTAFSVTACPRRDERGYWLTRISNKTGRFDCLRDIEPSGLDGMAAWVRGLFDSEGNATLRLNGMSKNSYGRRVAIYSTVKATLLRAAEYLYSLGMFTILRQTNNSAGHKGNLIVYELSLRGGIDNYRMFALLVGSSISRKQSVLAALPQSYSNPAIYCRKGQLKSAQRKHRTLMETTVPSVIQGIRELLESGKNPTQRACRVIPGYNSIQRYFQQSTLIAMARQ
jgi:hypothetical protein